MDSHTSTTSFVEVKTTRPPKKNWSVLNILWGLSIIGAVAVMPYSLTLQREVLSAGRLPLPIPAMVVLELIIQCAILYLIVLAGLQMANSMGLGAPMLTDWLAGKTWRQDNSLEFVLTVLIGLAISAMVAFLDALIFLPLMKVDGTSLPPIATPPMWEGLLSSLFGGVTEEIVLRLFLMSLFAWVILKLARRRGAPPSPAVMWTANLGVTLLYCLTVILSILALGLPLNVILVARILTLNILPGLIFGWLYWKRGIESAIVAHLSGDILLHALFPLLMP
jgi:hypothetical protein